jgi:hypothetical protein
MNDLINMINDLSDELENRLLECEAKGRVDEETLAMLKEVKRLIFQLKGTQRLIEAQANHMILLRHNQ